VLSRNLISPLLEALSGHPVNASTPAHELVHNTLVNIKKRKEKLEASNLATDDDGERHTAIHSAAAAAAGGGNKTGAVDRQEDDTRHVFQYMYI
jgi:hypothetical protein